MTEPQPTQESLDEAARAFGYTDWQHTDESMQLFRNGSIAYAHALDQLHNRKPRADEAAEFWDHLCHNLFSIGPNLFDTTKAIEAIRTKFAEIRAEKGEWEEVGTSGILGIALALTDATKKTMQANGIYLMRRVSK